MIRTRGFRSLAVGLFAACAAMIAAPAAQAGPTGAMSALTAGTGDFDARVKVNIHDAAPDTTFTVTRAIDAADGLCTSTDFVPVATLTTSAGGAGAVEFERGGRGSGPTVPFDLFLRVLGSDGTVLQSGCMTIIGK